MAIQEVQRDQRLHGLFRRDLLSFSLALSHQNSTTIPSAISALPPRVLALEIPSCPSSSLITLRYLSHKKPKRVILVIFHFTVVEHTEES